MPECLKCKVGLEFDETIDTCVDGDVVEMETIGHCPKCRKKYQWTDIYHFTEFRDLKERE